MDIEIKPAKKENFNPPLEIPATPFPACPDDCVEMINTYGTYNIQATADSSNEYPAIAQGNPPFANRKNHKFYRGPEDENPANEKALNQLDDTTTDLGYNK